MARCAINTATSRQQRSELGRSRACSVAGRASVSKSKVAGAEFVHPISDIVPSSNISEYAASDCLEVVSNASHESTSSFLQGTRKGAGTNAGARGSVQHLPERETSKPKLPLPPAGVVETFAPMQWLNDASILYASACLVSLGSSVLGGQSRKLPTTVSIMDPSAAFWFAFQDNPAEVEEAKKGLNLRDLDLLLCPINDSMDAEQADSGLHWTLLVCWVTKTNRKRCSASKTSASSASHFQRFRYYDSLGFGCSSADPAFRQATELASRLAGRLVEVSVGSCSRQMNFYDCGVYCLLFSEIIIDVFLGPDQHISPCDGEEPDWEDRLKFLTPEDASACRIHYLNLARGGGLDLP